MLCSNKGLVHLPFTEVIRVRIPYRVLIYSVSEVVYHASLSRRSSWVRIPYVVQNICYWLNQSMTWMVVY